MQDLPRFIETIISERPSAGGGLHNWLFRLARYLHGIMPEIEVSNTLRSLAADAGRRVPEREIRQAVKNSKSVAWQPPQQDKTFLEESRGPSIPARRQRLYRALDLNQTEERLRAASPNEPRFTPPVNLLHLLFPGDDTLICVGETLPEARTNYARFIRPSCTIKNQPLEPDSSELVDALMFQFIVPSAMRDKFGLTQEGKISKRCLDNVGPRCYAVVEFDEGRRDFQASCLHLLQNAFPLTMVVWSGSKSLHGWFNVHGRDETEIQRFYDLAKILGADMATRTPSQLARCPWGLRDNGNVQEVIYLDIAQTIGGAEDA